MNWKLINNGVYRYCMNMLDIVAKRYGAKPCRRCGQLGVVQWKDDLGWQSYDCPACNPDNVKQVRREDVLKVRRKLDPDYKH